MNKRRNAFTLVELLVVLAIIAILAAILFPAFNRAKENARQASCISNLQQIGFAVLQYRKDEGRYPDTLLDILGEGAKYDATPANAPATAPAVIGTLGSNAPAYFKGGQDSLLCPDDDTLSERQRASYGFLSKNPVAPIAATPTTQVTNTGDLSQFVWNYWGYRQDGFAYTTPEQAKSDTPIGSDLLVTPSRLVGTTQTPQAYNQPYASGYVLNDPINVLKYSMSNRFAPPTTIITHCIYHRLPTANNLNSAAALYAVPADDANVKEIILRVDGSAKAVDVAAWKPPTGAPATAEKIWQKQTS